jgi:hypothetical protein
VDELWYSVGGQLLLRESEKPARGKRNIFLFYLCIPLYKVYCWRVFLLLRRRLKIKCCALYPGSLKLYILVEYRYGHPGILDKLRNLQNVRSITSPLPDREPRVKVSQKNALSKITSRPLSRTKVATKLFLKQFAAPNNDTCKCNS